MQRIALIVHNVRSAHNVGSLLRSCDGLGIDRVYLTGYTPYPAQQNDERLPHIRRRVDSQIHKTALGAEQTFNWSYHKNINAVLDKLSGEGFLIAALEQTTGAKLLPSFRYAGNIALIVGSEIGGIDSEILKRVGLKLKIPMSGTKESFNVAVAGAMALYHLRYLDKKSV